MLRRTRLVLGATWPILVVAYFYYLLEAGSGDALVISGYALIGLSPWWVILAVRQFIHFRRQIISKQHTSKGQLLLCGLGYIFNLLAIISLALPAAMVLKM